MTTDARPIIGIVPTHLPVAGDIRLACNYADAVIAAGGAPLILPLSADEAVYPPLFALLDGVLLTGGHDVDPARWCPEAVPAHETAASAMPAAAQAETPTASTSGPAAEPAITPLRDEVEYRLIAFALKHGLPLYGICRGLQILNVYLGGTLYDDLPRDFPATKARPLCEHNAHTPSGDYDGDRLVHEVALAPGSQLERIFGIETLAVNSLHHQAARAVAPAFRVTATAPDGVIEGIEAADGRPIVAVQWHPEYFGATAPMNRFFKALVAAAHKGRLARA